MAWYDVLSIAGLWKGGAPVPVSDTDPLPTAPIEAAVLAKSVTTSTAGNTTIATPAAGKKIRLFWWGMSASPDNGATVTAGLKFGASSAFVSVPLSKYGGIFAHGYKGGRAYVEGAANEALILNLSAAQSVTLNIDYQEI